MLNFIKNFLTNKGSNNQGKKGSENLVKYENLLSSFLSDGKLDENERAELKKFSDEYNLTEAELFNCHSKTTSNAFKNIISDQKITEEERESLELLFNYFGIKKENTNFNQETFNKYYTLGLIDKGILPEIKDHNFNILFKKGEILHWGVDAVLRKYKTVTNRINYAGPIGSIKIMKGVRFRIGSLGFVPSTKEHLIEEDCGYMWLTNKRIGFKGQRKSFTLDFTKLLCFELTNAGLELTKEGKNIPYIIGLKEYDIPCLLIDQIINKIN